ncbi:MAG: insulinase family protein [Propionibacteriaceae bacterium]|nr:insulinase family protein [Propionibacteriaceae bacterium]
MDHTYPLRTTVTSNGIRVAVNPDPWVSGVSVNLWYLVGSVHEAAGKTGFAHLFEHLMFSGSANVSSGEHLGVVQSMGGNANATTSFDRTNYFETVPAGGLDLALWLEAERLSSLLDSVDQVNLDTQRDVVKEEKRQRYDNVPYGDAFPRLMSFLFPGTHPYAHMPIGSMEDLDSATLEDVHGFFHSHYSPSNLILTLSGAVEPEDGFALVDRYFGHIAPGRPTPRPDLGVLAPLTGLPRLDVSGDVPQDVVYCSWLVPPIADDANDPLGLGLSILAGSMTSRLHTDLVRTSVADSVEAFDLGLEHGNSVIMATAACAEGVTPEQVEETLMRSWDRFLQEGPTDDEVSRAIRSEERDFLADLSSIEHRSDHISASWSYFGDANEINKHMDTIKALSADDIRAACATWLRPDNAAIMTYRRSL